jgi:hypothetical protein
MTTAYIFFATQYPTISVDEIIESEPSCWLELMISMEDQARSAASLHPEDDFGDRMQRMSPVQLCKGEGPGPSLSLWGHPFGEFGAGEFKLGFSDPSRLLRWESDGTLSDSDAQRCVLLVRETVAIAIRRSWGVVFMSAPGWDYETNELSLAQQVLFSNAGMRMHSRHAV